MKILVTGTAGFIGSFVAQKLLERGDEVVGLDSINNYYDVQLKFARLQQAGIARDSIAYNKLTTSTLDSRYRFVQLKLEDKESLYSLFADEHFDSVCNLAAQAGVRYSLTNPDAYIHSNIIGFMNLLELCRNFEIAHLVYASSSSVYGINQDLRRRPASDFIHPGPTLDR